MTTYTYSKSAHTLNSDVNARGLHSEIQSSSITIALDSVNVNEDVIDVVFKAALSSQEQSTLDSVLAMHDAAATPNDPAVVTIGQEDPDTKAVLITQKLGPDNSYEQFFETEWKTSTLDSIHEKDIDNNDIGWSSLKFFELVGGVETEMVSPTQNDLDTKCVRTDLLWQPDEDYWVKSGKVGHTVELDDNLYVWARGSDGLANLVFVEGGMNLRFLAAKDKMGVEGASSTHMPQTYQHPEYGPLPANIVRVVARHPVGLKHSLQLLMGIFRLKS